MTYSASSNLCRRTDSSSTPSTIEIAECPDESSLCVDDWRTMDDDITQSVCVPDSEQGGTCAQDIDCISGFCFHNLCYTALGTQASACFDHSWCDQGFLCTQYFSGLGICEYWLAEGHYCTPDDAGEDTYDNCDSATVCNPATLKCQNIMNIPSGFEINQDEEGEIRLCEQLAMYTEVDADGVQSYICTTPPSLESAQPETTCDTDDDCLYAWLDKENLRAYDNWYEVNESDLKWYTKDGTQSISSLGCVCPDVNSQDQTYCALGGGESIFTTPLEEVNTIIL